MTSREIEAKYLVAKNIIRDNPSWNKETCIVYSQGYVTSELYDQIYEEMHPGEETNGIPSAYLKLLQDKDLFNKITGTEFNKKIVGEEETRKVIFLCANGRLVENGQIASFNLLVNDDAGAGKDYVTGAVLDIFPTEVYVHKTRISPAVFTYWHNPEYEPDWTWDGKIFYPEDISENVLNSDVFKVMCSKGSSATMVIKQKAHEIDIQGKPVMITTTATATPNPELARRFVMLNLDSSEDQTKAIMKRHSEFKKKGIVPEYDPSYTEAMRYLQRVKVKIPFADLIDKHFPSQNIIMRTNYPRFLDFISASAAFHQYQRENDEDGYVLAVGQDYDIARDCFMKLCSNKYMIPLSINQKRILEGFKKFPHIKASASSLHATTMGFMALKNLQDNLQKLVKFDILEIGMDTLSNREVEVYSLSKSYNPNEKISLPRFNELQIEVNQVNDISQVSGVSMVSKVHKVSRMENKDNVYLTYDVYHRKSLIQSNSEGLSKEDRIKINSGETIVV